MILKRKTIRICWLLILILSASCTPRLKTTPTILVGADAKKLQKIKIQINDRATNQFGPQLPSGTEVQDVSSSGRDAIVAIYCHDALYRSLYCLDVIEKVSKETKVSILSGSGMSAVVLALYAKYKNKNKVQWKYFKLIKRLKKKRIFYPSWFNELNKFLKGEFGNKNIQQLSKIMFLPFFDRASKQFKLIGVGKSQKLLLDQFNHIGQKSIGSPIVSKNIFDAQTLKKAGADIVYSISLGIEQLNLSLMDGQYFGDYGRYFSKLPSVQESPFIYYYKDTKPIDVIRDFLIEEQIPATQLEQSAQRIKSDVGLWKDENSN